MAALGEKSFCVLEYHASKSVVTVQRAFRAKYARTLLQTRLFVRGKNNLLKLGIDAPMLTHMCGKNLNIVSMCAVSPVVHISNLSCQKKSFFSFPVAVNNFFKGGPLVLLL